VGCLPVPEISSILNQYLNDMLMYISIRVLNLPCKNQYVLLIHNIYPIGYIYIYIYVKYFFSIVFKIYIYIYICVQFPINVCICSICYIYFCSVSADLQWF